MTLRISRGFNGVTDPDAGAYIAAVEAADGQLLEFAVGRAINNFVVGCKADGIWSAIKASCILAGARTLAGALVPLVGAAPTNNNFVAGDYNRKTGLVGNGTSKYLNSNRAGTSEQQNNRHLAVYSSSISTVTCVYAGSDNLSTRNSLYAILGSGVGVSLSASAIDYTTTPTTSAIGLISGSRYASNLTEWRASGSSGAFTQVSLSTTPSGNIFVFCRNDNGSAATFTNARLAFYSIGESLDLAKLDARVTDLINAIGAAIP